MVSVLDCTCYDVSNDLFNQSSYCIAQIQDIPKTKLTTAIYIYIYICTLHMAHKCAPPERPAWSGLHSVRKYTSRPLNPPVVNQALHGTKQLV